MAQILLEAWPTQVATPLAKEVQNVLGTARGDVLTIGVMLAIFFASSGIESLRIGLNRAYGVTETRSWWLLRLESIGYVLIAAIGAAGAGVSGGAGAADLRHRGALRAAGSIRSGRCSTSCGSPPPRRCSSSRCSSCTNGCPPATAGCRRLRPGIIVTLLLWLVAGELFGDYLSGFAYTYVSYYAGLASVMMALVFLYLAASIFIYGAELNTVICKLRKEMAATQPA